MNFYGLNDEYVVSGSDCGHLFICRLLARCALETVLILVQGIRKLPGLFSFCMETMIQ